MSQDAASSGLRQRPSVIRCPRQVKGQAASRVSGGEQGEAAPESPLSPWGSVFALWGRDEKVEGEEGDGGLGTAQPIIHAILLFDGGLPSLMETKLFLQEKLLPHKRFCKKITVPGQWGQPTWASIEVDVNQHVREVILEPLPPGTDPLATRSPLHRHVEEALRHGLPDDRPPWEVHLLSYSDGRGGGAMLWRIHHSIGDGISLASLLLSLADGGAPPLPTNSTNEARAPASGLYGPASRAASAVLRAASLAWNTVASAAGIVYLLCVPDLPSAVRAEGQLYRKHCRRGLAISAEVPLAHIKAVGRTAGATVNEVLMAAMSAAVARYETEMRPGSKGGQRLTFLMMVNIRPIKGIQADIAASANGEDTHWGNCVGPVMGLLPLFDRHGGEIPARDRLARMRALLRAKKLSLEPVLLAMVLRILAWTLGPAITYAVTDRLGYCGTTLISNVPGPQVPVYICGREVTGICNVVNGTPQGAQFSFLSYNGALRLALTASLDVIPDPGVLTSLFLKELEDLASAIGVPFGNRL